MDDRALLWAKMWLRARVPPRGGSLTAKCCVSAGPGSEAAHAVVNFLCGEIPVDPAIFFFENGSNRGFRVTLWTRNNCARSQTAQGFFDERRARFRHARGQFGGCFRGGDFDFALNENIAG